ncbi:CapA family protein [Candidatus Poribacteria bacterium]
MRKRLTVILLAAVVFIAVALWFLSWFPGHSYQSSVPSDVAELAKGKPEDFEESSKEVREDLRILFVGDTSFGENYIRKSFIEYRGYDYFLEKVAPLSRGSDMVIANLETPLTDLDKSPLSWKKRYIHWGDVDKAPATLKNHNVRFVSLANNHTMDYGVEGLTQTMLALQKSGIAWFGAGLDGSQAAKPLRSSFMIGKHPFNLVVASGFDYEILYSSVYHFYANEDHGGVNRWERKDAVQQISRIRQSESDAFIVAFPHWECNYRFKTGEQMRLAHALIEAGSDLVIGHGAHMLQEIEYYRSKWILYGLGNFVFNSPGRYQKEGVDPFSLAASLDVVDKAERLTLTLRLYPIFSDNRITKYQPRLVTKEELNRVKSTLLMRSPDPEHLQRELMVGEDEFGLFLALDVDYQGL